MATRPAPRERTGLRMPEGLDVGQLAVAFERHSLVHRRAQEAHDPDHVGEDRVDGRAGAASLAGRGAAPGVAAARRSAPEFDLELTVPHPQARQTSVVEGLGERAHTLRNCVFEHRIPEFRDNRERSRPTASKRSSKRLSSERAIERNSGDRQPRFVVPRRLSARLSPAGIACSALDTAGIAHHAGAFPSRATAPTSASPTSSKPNGSRRSVRATKIAHALELIERGEPCRDDRRRRSGRARR